MTNEIAAAIDRLERTVEQVGSRFIDKLMDINKSLEMLQTDPTNFQKTVEGIEGSLNQIAEVLVDQRYEEGKEEEGRHVRE